MSELTVNELNTMQEQLNRERMMVKKYKMYAHACTDPQLRQKCEQVAAKHQDHYLRLLNQLS
jgi:hypothetical protein